MGCDVPQRRVLADRRRPVSQAARAHSPVNGAGLAVRSVEAVGFPGLSRAHEGAKRWFGACGFHKEL